LTGWLEIHQQKTSSDLEGSELVMKALRKSEDRGHFDHGWLDTRHTFSFADYYDPAHMGFSTLRVINEDKVAPARGFGAHPHRDMEILTWVVSGAVEHADSMGNRAIVRPGEIQRMTAGTGVTHSEINPSSSEPLHLLQIWIVPDRRGLEPGYEQRAFADADRQGRLLRIASPDAADASVRIHQDVSLFTSLLAPGDSVQHALPGGRHAWLQVIRGDLDASGVRVRSGDGVAVSDEPGLTVTAHAPSELLLFDLS
jgi:redox-sensitive bicupin YhaK (pirin superfamily)